MVPRPLQKIGDDSPVVSTLRQQYQSNKICYKTSKHARKAIEHTRKQDKARDTLRKAIKQSMKQK